MTNAEKKLWGLFRSRILGNYKFRRQYPIGPYIADFACLEASLIIEVDGGQHCADQNDITRAEWLQQNGWRVVRFWNNEVLGPTEVVAQIIKNKLQPLTRPATPVDLSHQGEGSNHLPS